jgi:hypothetical protein
MFDNLRADAQHYSRFCYNGRLIMRVLLQIPPPAHIGPGLAIMHFGGVVITRDCYDRAEDPSENRTLPHRPSEWLEPSGRGNAQLGSGVPVNPAAAQDHIPKPQGAEAPVREPATRVRKQQ